MNYTQEQIRAYILGQMPEEQIAAFDTQLKRDHDLSQQLDQCLDEMEKIDFYLLGQLSDEAHHQVEEEMKQNTDFLSEVKETYSFHKAFQIFVAQDEQYDDVFLMSRSSSAKIISLKSVQYIRMISKIAAVILLLVAAFFQWGNHKQLKIDNIVAMQFLDGESADSEWERTYKQAIYLYSLGKEKNYEASAKLFSTLLPIEDDSLQNQILWYRGSAYLKSKHYKEAILDLERVQDEQPQAEFDLALAYALSGEYEKAMQKLLYIRDSKERIHHPYRHEIDKAIERINWLSYRPAVVATALCLAIFLAVFPFFRQKDEKS